MSYLHLLTPMRAAARRAATFLRGSVAPRDPAAWTLKASRDFVTAIDRDAEALIAEILLAAEPQSGLVGEESSPAVQSRGLVWVVDPLDGTTNFLHGYPQWAVSIGAAVDGALVAGVVLHVPQDRCCHAALGAGAWVGDERLRVSPIDDPAFALIGTGFPFKDVTQLDAYVRQFSRIAATTSGMRRAGSAALDLADVAAGRFEGFWEQMLAPWDVAAGTVLIREAGGVVTDFAGQDVGVAHTSVVAGSPRMHAWLMEQIAP